MSGLRSPRQPRRRRSPRFLRSLPHFCVRNGSKTDDRLHPIWPRSRSESQDKARRHVAAPPRRHQRRQRHCFDHSTTLHQPRRRNNLSGRERSSNNEWTAADRNYDTATPTITLATQYESSEVGLVGNCLVTKYFTAHSTGQGRGRYTVKK